MTTEKEKAETFQLADNEVTAVFLCRQKAEYSKKFHSMQSLSIVPVNLSTESFLEFTKTFQSLKKLSSVFKTFQNVWKHIKVFKIFSDPFEDSQRLVF